jgi:hypothetical protein
MSAKCPIIPDGFMRTGRKLALAAACVAATTPGCHDWGGPNCGPNSGCSNCAGPQEGCDCRWCVDRCADIPPGAIPPPAGTYTCRWIREEVDRANQDIFVVNQSEWYMGGDQLGPDGRVHLSRLAAKLCAVPNPIVVAATEDPALNMKRQFAVIEGLAQLGVPDAGQRVVIAVPEAEPLYGQEAARIGAVRLQGGPTTGGTGAGGGGGAAGFGGGVVGVGGTQTGLGGGGGMGMY